MGDEVKDAWSEVADGFARLGQAIRDGYVGQGLADERAVRPTDPVDIGLRDALERFVAAGRDIGQRASGMARDVDVSAHARQVASSLNDALSATVDMIGREVAGWFERHDPTATTDDGTSQLGEAPTELSEPTPEKPASP